MLSGLAPGEAVGSAILIPELLIKPTRGRREQEVTALLRLLSQLLLQELTVDLGRRAVQIGATYGLKTADAIHLATAVEARANRFLTNNRRDFKPEVISEIEVVFPESL